MTSTIMIDTADHPNLVGQQDGRELELEVRAIVTSVRAQVQEGGSPSELVTLIVVDADITQST